MALVVWLALLVAVTSYISSISTGKLGAFLWDLYTKYSPDAQVTEIKAKRKRLEEIRKERSNTSSKDEFAKWAKLDRDHRKLKTEIDALNVVMGQTRAKIQQSARVGKWVSSTGIKLVVQWRYRKVPIIFLPRGVLPSSVEWFLSLPSAPTGSISVATWIAITSTAFTAAITNFRTVRDLIKGEVR